jgi:hypothetical protein
MNPCRGKISMILLNDILIPIINDTDVYVYHRMAEAFTKISFHIILVDNLHNRFTDNANI